MNSNNRRKIFVRDGFRCRKCNQRYSEDRLQLAHRIRQGTGSEKHIRNYCLDVYGLELTFKFIREKIIDHPLNVVSTCSLECNSWFNIFFKSNYAHNLIDRILLKLGLIK